MKDKKKLRILFIGNSHTYFNDMPATVADLAREERYDCEVTMIAHGGWFLAQHVQEPETRFNIMHGHYDYVVLQEHAHPFGPVEKYFDAVWNLDEWIQKARAKTVIYMTWAKKDEPGMQPAMTAAHEQIARETDALLAPVGKEWWAFREENPGVEMYAPDGQHASEYGSWFAAKHIWHTIQTDLDADRRMMNPELEDYLEDLECIEAFDYLT